MGVVNVNRLASHKPFGKHPGPGVDFEPVTTQKEKELHDMVSEKTIP